MVGVYIPPKFALTDHEIAAALQDPGMAHLITPAAGGPVITPLPVLYDAQRHTLVTHMARANDHWKVEPLTESVATIAGVDGYISPSWYATTRETGKEVPTWNYEIINVYGDFTVHDDPAWLTAHVTALSVHHERDRAEPWSIEEVPQSYVEHMLKAIVGIEMRISRWEGKAKMSQNQPTRNLAGIVSALDDSPEHAQRELGRAVRRHTGLID